MVQIEFLNDRGLSQHPTSRANRYALRLVGFQVDGVDIQRDTIVEVPGPGGTWKLFSSSVDSGLDRMVNPAGTTTTGQYYRTFIAPVHKPFKTEWVDDVKPKTP